MQRRLSQLEAEYHKQMSQLAEGGKWTPFYGMGKSIKLSFLIGEFHGALQSYKIEMGHQDKTSIGCDEVKKKKEALRELCSGS